MERRSFLKAILLAGAAPAIIKAEILMPVKKIAEPKLILPDYLKVDGYTDEEVIGVEHLVHVRKMLDAAPFPNDLLDHMIHIGDLGEALGVVWHDESAPIPAKTFEQIERAEKPPGKQPKSVQNYLDMRGKYGR